MLWKENVSRPPEKASPFAFTFVHISPLPVEILLLFFLPLDPLVSGSHGSSNIYSRQWNQRNVGRMQGPARMCLCENFEKKRKPFIRFVRSLAEHVPSLIYISFIPFRYFLVWFLPMFRCSQDSLDVYCSLLSHPGRLDRVEPTPANMRNGEIIMQEVSLYKIWVKLLPLSTGIHVMADYFSFHSVYEWIWEKRPKFFICEVERWGARISWVTFQEAMNVYQSVIWFWAQGNDKELRKETF